VFVINSVHVQLPTTSNVRAVLLITSHKDSGDTLWYGVHTGHFILASLGNMTKHKALKPLGSARFSNAILHHSGNLEGNPLSANHVEEADTPSHAGPYPDQEACIFGGDMPLQVANPPFYSVLRRQQCE
jgi:hypothetical protein